MKIISSTWLRGLLRSNVAILLVGVMVAVLPVAMQTPQRANAAGMTGFSSVVAGDSFTCGVKTDGTVWCWGRNHKKQLGDGTTTTRSRPVQVIGLTGVTQIIAGQGFACALKSNGTVACWGDNASGQLGDGTTTGRSTPAVIPNLTDVTQISGNYSHVCARLSDSTARCWGWNALYNLGDGTTTNRPSPVAPSNLTDIAQISAGVFHTCARLNDKTVRCWGAGNNGGLGDGNTTYTTSTKTSPTGLSDVVQIATGGGWNNQCALLSTGVLKCWGLNTNGQVGNGIVLTGSTIKQLTPVTTGPFPAAISSVDFGMYTSCAVLLDQSKSAVCWGYNGDGQIGDGTVVNKSVPTLVSGLTDVNQISTNYYHSCAVLADTTVKCWGRNMYGELGNGTTVSSLTAVSIPAFLDIPTPVAAAPTVSVSKSIDVSWGAVTNKTSYTVRLYDVAGTNVLATKAGITATSTTFTSAEYASIADNTNYKVTVTAIGDGTVYINSDESAKVSVTASAAPSIADQPAAASRTSGQSVTFSVVASVTDGGTLSYQWLKSGASIPNATLSSYTISPLATSDAGSFSVRVTNTVTGKIATFTTSSAVALTVANALTIETPTTGLSGTAYSAFSLPVTGAGGLATLSYALTGTLVNGLSLSTSTGTISGTPTVAGTSTVSVTVNDANGATASTSNFTISIGYASTTVSLELASGSPQYRTTKRITATTSRAGTVNFMLGGTTITGCGAVAAASTTAVCDWVPVDLGAAALSVVFTPTASTAYSNSTASLSATVAGRAITVTPTSGQSKVFGASDPVIQYSITSGSLYGQETLTGSLSRVPGEDAGTYSISGGTLSNANYDITLTSVNFSITQGTQATVSLTTTSGVFGTGLTLVATGGSGTGAYSFAVTTVGTAGCSITSGVLNATSPGTCTVTATRALSTNYLVANSVATTVNISKALQAAVTLTSTSGTFNTNVSLTASGGSGTGGYSYSVSDAGTAVCSIVSTTSLTSSGAGTCTVTATRAGDDDYESQSSVATLVTFAKDTQSALSITDVSGDLNTGITLSTSGGSGTGSVTYTATSGSASCSITSGVANARNAGTCSLTATKGTDSNYLQKQVTSTLTFVKATQTALQITSTSGTYGTPIELTISGGSGTGSVSYSVSDAGSASCSETGSLLSFTAVGTCKVIATRNADSVFNARSSAATTITISRATQTPLAVSTTTGDLVTGIIVATTGGSGSGATTSTVTTGTASCSLTSGVVTAKSAGTCVLTVTKASDSSYLSESVTATLTFTKVISTTGKIGSVTTGTVGSDISLSFTGGSGTGSVTYVVSTPGTAKCTVTDNKLSATAAGTCTVTITKQGDDTYADQVVRTEFTFTSAQVAAAPTVPQGQTNVAAVTTTTTTTTTTTVAPSVAQSPIATTTTVPVVAKSGEKPVVTTTTTTTTSTTVAPKPQPVAPSIVNTPSTGGAATIGGKVAKATTTRVNNQLVFTAGGFTVTLAGVRPDGSIIPLTSEGLLEVQRGDTFRLDAQGFAPGSNVDIWMFSKPVLLANIEVGANGLVRSTLKVPKSVSDGLHHLVMVGVDKANAEAKFEVGMNVGVPAKQWWLSRWLLIIPITLAVFAGFWLPTTARRRKRRLI